MKNTFLIGFLLLVTNLTFIICYQCPDTVILSTQTYNCTTVFPSRVFNSPSFNIPSGQTTLTINFDIKVTSLCSAPSPQHLAVASVGTNRFMDFIIDTDNTPTINTQTTAGATGLIYFIDKPFPQNVWITMVATLDTTAQTFAGAIITPTDGLAGHGNDPITGMVKPDSTMQISVCSDIGGINRIGCLIANLQVIYTTYSETTLLAFAFGTEPVLVAYYKFKEGTGFSAKSDIATLGTAYLGASTATTSDTTNSPAWAGTDKALSFTAITQYLTVPTFTLAPSNKRANTASLSIHFWFQATATPSAAGDPIFTYTAADLVTNRISIAIYDTLTMSVIVGTTKYSNNPLATFTLSTWTEVIANIVLLDQINATSATGMVFVSLNFAGTYVLDGKAASTLLSTDFKASDIVRIGGYVGQIADLRIYTPGAYYMSTTPCTVGCPFELGATNPSTCFQPECGLGSFATSCINCPSTCTSCSANSICRTCPAGSGLSGGNCGVCPSGSTAASFTSPCKAPTVISAGGAGSTPNGPGGTTVEESTTTTTNVGGIIGIAIGATAGALIIFGVGYYCIMKKIRMRRNAVMQITQNSQMNTYRVDNDNQTMSLDIKPIDY